MSFSHPFQVWMEEAGGKENPDSDLTCSLTPLGCFLQRAKKKLQDGDPDKDAESRGA